jgi:hypothetical protein
MMREASVPSIKPKSQKIDSKITKTPRAQPQGKGGIKSKSLAEQVRPDVPNVLLFFAYDRCNNLSSTP